MSDQERKQPPEPRNDGGEDGGGNNRPPVRISRNIFSWIIIFGLALILVFMLNQSMNKPREISWNQLEVHLGNGDVEIAVLKTDAIEGKLKPGRAASNNGVENDRYRCLFIGLQEQSVEVLAMIDKARGDHPLEIEFEQSNYLLTNILLSMIPWLLLFGIIYFFLFRQLRQTGAGAGMLGNFGRSRHKISTKEHTNITFADVAGIEEAKEEVYEIVEFLRNPKRFQRLGGRIPRGVLLVGDPGCGKTLLAKAIAGEADVPFFSISGSDFVEMFVGVGASRVRDLFRQAKENSPCIIFLDEIDAVGRRRGVGYSGGGHDEREQTLNAILVEMDGFESNDQVIVIAATNRADVLDPALVRPGRFDRQVYVPLPDVKGRFEILRVHAKKVKILQPVDPKIKRLARATPMFSGADLAALINESALLATLAGKDAVDLEDLEEARDKVRWGRAKRSRVVDEKDRVLTAYHEAGHALVQSVLPDTDPVHKVSIIPRGPYGGATFSLPEQERMAVNRKYAEAMLRVACAGRIAEELMGKDVNSGASGDIRQATNLARSMVTQWGMSDALGFVFYGEEQSQWSEFGISNKDFSEKTAERIDEEVRRIIEEAFTDAKRILGQNQDKLESLGQALLRYETLDGEEVRKIMAGETLDRPTVADLIAAEQERRDVPAARPVSKPDEHDAGGALPSPA